MKKGLTALPVLLFSTEAHAAAPDECIPPPFGCPAPGTCIEIQSDHELDPSCEYRDVTFYITGSGSAEDPLVFDCRGARLEGAHTTETAIDLHTDVVHGPFELENVVVQRCTVDGYKYGIKLYQNRDAETREEIRTTYAELFFDPLLLDDVIGSIESTLRETAPQSIRFDDVHATEAKDVGLYIFAYVHHVTFEDGSATDNGGPGIYLDTGSRQNLIRNSVISGNGREGIAIDSSAFNYIGDNLITDNEKGGVLLYRNFWENSETQSPRTQHAYGNTITGNTIRSGSHPAVWIGARQSQTDNLDKWGDPVYLYRGDNAYWRDNAEFNVITDNIISSSDEGIIVYDDDTLIVGNELTSTSILGGVGIRVGNDIRRYAGEPIHGTVISDNDFTGSPFIYKPVHIIGCTAGTSGTGNLAIGSPYELPDVECASMRTTAWAHHGTASGFEEESSFDRLTHVFTSDTRAITGDFDGDGSTDLALVHGTSDGQARITLHLSTESGFEHRTHYQWFPDYHPSDHWLAGDVDGDGMDDLVRVFEFIGWAQARVHYSSGDEFAYFDTPTSVFGAFDEDQQWLLGDFNGDETDDLVMISELFNGHCYAWVSGSDGVTFSWLTSLTELANYWTTQQWRVGDFNGDGMDDLVNVYGSSGQATAWVHGSTGTGFEYVSTFDRLAGFSDQQKWLVTDFNSDGLDDLVNVYGNNGVARAWRHAYTGSGFEYQTGFQVLESFFNNQRWVTGDFDGDGYGDLLDVYGASSDAW